MTELRRGAKHWQHGIDSWHAVCGNTAGIASKGEEKCQDAARLKLRSARRMSTRSTHKPLNRQD
jgi:hypothetical protein